jgi:hypothetical protein
MQPNQMPDFAALLTDVMAYYGKDCSNFTLQVWWAACQRFDYEQVATAMQRHATDPDRGQFAPKVADIIRVLDGTTTDRAALAWGKVLEAMGSVGAYSDVVFDDPAIHAAVEDLGGWPKVCRTETKELSFLQHRFQEAHRAYTGRGQFAYPRRLAGDRSPDHDYERRGLPLPKAALVGDERRAALVYQGGGAAGKLPIRAVSLQLLGQQLGSDVKPRLLEAA